MVDNYGFCLDYGANPFSSWKFRVKIGTKVDSLAVDNTLAALIPPDSVYTDTNAKIEDQTELIAV